MKIEYNIYDKITNIINESFKSQGRIPNIKDRKSFEIVGGKTLLIDVPKKSKLHYHSSSYTVECDENKKICRTDGNLITDLNTGNDVKKNLDNLKCDVLAIHSYDSKTIKSTHVHFRCEDKSYDETLNIFAKFIGKF